MFKNKSFALLLLLLAHIAHNNMLQARPLMQRRPAQQPQNPIAIPQVAPVSAQPAPIAQPAAQIQQPRNRRQAKQRPQRNKRTRPTRGQQKTTQPQQPAILPTAPIIQQPIPLRTVASVPQSNIAGAPRLTDFDFGGASVLPTFIDQNGKKYLILSREAGGKDKGTYDDFGGARDFIGPKQNNIKEAHPVITAAREFFEEAILELTLNFSLQNAQDLIDVKNMYTEYVIASGRNVIYITDFTQYTNQFLSEFYKAFRKTTSRHSKEKNRIAIIEWNELKTIINNNPFNTGIIVDAEVLNPLDLQWYVEKITLRPFFAKKLRSFWMDKPYQQGLSKKIRFY